MRRDSAECRGSKGEEFLGKSRAERSAPPEAVHADPSLIGSKLEKYRKLTDQELIDSLKPGQPGSLKARPDGTIVDNHRIKILRDRGVNVDSLPRDVIPKDSNADPV